MGWVVVLEGGDGGGGDGNEQLYSELTVGCEQQDCSYTTELQINNQKSTAGQREKIRGRLTNSWTGLLALLSEGEKARSW